jgi:hypothetical protein
MEMANPQIVSDPKIMMGKPVVAGPCLMSQYMPEISRFHGVVIRMYYSDNTQHHQPHFHAVYNQYEASFAIDPPVLLAGAMPRRQLNLVQAWAELHVEELLENWRRARAADTLNPIEGLR